MPTDQSLAKQITDSIVHQFGVDAVYLYGSRAAGHTHSESDWDFAVLFTTFEQDLLKRHLRPQEVEAYVEQQFRLYEKISVVDLEIAPPPLQYNIIQGNRLYDRLVPHVRRVENAIYSVMEKDYAD